MRRSGIYFPDMARDIYGRRVPTAVKEAVKAFVIERKLPFGQYNILLKLAIKSYKALPLADRAQWSLEEVVKQGL